MTLDNPMPLWRREFEAFPCNAVPDLPAGWVDQSWRNDLCPSFVNKGLGLLLWCDHPDAEERECGADFPRFALYPVDGEGVPTSDSTILNTESWEEVLAFIARRAVPTIGPSTTYAVLRDTLDNITLIPSGNEPFTGSDRTELARLTKDQWEAIQEAVSRCQDRIDDGADEDDARIVAHNLDRARRTLFNAMLNQVGVDEGEAKESVEILEARLRASGDSDAEVTTKLLLDATRYLDM